LEELERRLDAWYQGVLNPSLKRLHEAARSGLPYELEEHEPATSYMLMLHQGQFSDPEEDQGAIRRAFELHLGKLDPLKKDVDIHLKTPEGLAAWFDVLTRVRQLSVFGDDGKLHLSNLAAKTAFDTLLGRRTEKQKAGLRMMAEGSSAPVSDASLEDTVAAYETVQASEQAGENVDFNIELRTALDARLRDSRLGRARRCALECFEDLPPLGSKSFEEVARAAGLAPQSVHEAHQDELVRLAKHLGLAG